MGTTTSGNVTWLPAQRPGQVRGRVLAYLPSLRAMWRAITTRRLLAEMDDRMLADIGISRSDALVESDRLPWDVTSR